MVTEVKITRNNPDSIHTPRGYSHVVEVSGSKTLYISGQVALNKEGLLIGEGSLKAQTEQVFENLKAILTSVKADFSNVVKLTYFLIDISQIQQVRDIRDKYFDSSILPASSAVEVRNLFRNDVLIEIEAIAVI